MGSELGFRVALAVIGSVYGAARIYYTAVAVRADPHFLRPRGDWRQLVYGTLGFLLAGLVAVYVFAPRALAWAVLPLPAGWRWFGAGLGMVVAGLLLWVHHNLGTNFAGPGITKERQALITSGPYRWVRHPMYTTFYLIALVYGLVSANWFIALVGLGWVSFAVVTLLSDEEAALIAKFGDEYRVYMGRTGRFLPRLV